MQFVTKNNFFNDFDFDTIHGNKKIATVNSPKFLGITLDNTLSWRPHIDAITSKLSSAGFALRIIKHFLSLESLRMVYFSYFQSLMTYGIIFWANSYYSKVNFQLQKRVIRFITGIRNRESCREHFRTLKILPLQSQYILSLLIFVIDNKDHFKRNFEVHHINTRNKLSLHQPLSNPSICQKVAYCTAIRVFNSLPPQIRKLSHNRQHYKRIWKNFLYSLILYIGGMF